MALVFNRIENGSVFTRDFSPLVQNNQISFPTSEKIAVIYGPNGTGKTSLIKVLDNDSGTRVEFTLDDVSYTSGNGVFHIIHDQNNRNIIAGDTRDFFLGDNIRHEFELQDQVSADRDRLLADVITLLKNTFGISAGNSPLVEFIENTDLVAFIKDCLNNKSKGSRYSADAIEHLLNALSLLPVGDYEEQKLAFVQTQYANKQSVIKKIDQLSNNDLTPNEHVHQIEENSEAINILSRFHKDTCIVCDTEGINRERLLAAKQANRQQIISALNAKVRELIEQIIQLLPSEDPFAIKSRLLNVVSTGDTEGLAAIRSEFMYYRSVYNALVINSLVDIWRASPLLAHLVEYRAVIAERPDISDEDYLYIQEIISTSMNKPLSVDRDTNNRLKIHLNHEEFLGKPRDELPLSTGEQNFLSLTFEFLKAKNSACPIVVIDDPVSSFDSIYKNKVVYAIVKMLHDKMRIVLTHNTDLIRLLDGQHRRCFKLYLLNNTEGELNGFIALNNNEQEMLISLEKLLEAFRSTIPNHVQNKELFLISMIPFMRGYANIINNRTLFEQLTQVMHGYKTESVDIAAAYSVLFGDQGDKLPSSYVISVPEILGKTVDGIHLLDATRYPLLDKTLRHSFTYLFLRLMVEKNLVERFGIDTTRHSQLGQIISAAYPDATDIGQIRNRIRLTSKKTLINEFNHFEGNLSIFQPAIDITDQALGKERTDITTFVSTVDVYLPELRGYPHCPTILQLATHTSGLTNDLERSTPEAARALEKRMAAFSGDHEKDCVYQYITEDDVIDQVRFLQHADHGGFLYSNIGYALLGSVLGKAGGAPYQTLMMDMIRHDLGLQHTWLDLPGGVPVLAGMGTDNEIKGNWRWAGSGAMAAGAIYATLDDMISYIQRYIDNQPGWLQWTHHRVCAECTPQPFSIGLGWIKEGNLTWHNGGTGCFRAFVGFREDRPRGVVLLANCRERNSITVDTIGKRMLKEDMRI